MPNGGDEEMNGQGYSYSIDGITPDVTLDGLKSSKGFCRRTLDVIKEYDRGLSDRIASNNNTCIEMVFFCLPAHLFNRILIIIPMGFCFLIGSLNYDTML